MPLEPNQTQTERVMQAAIAWRDPEGGMQDLFAVGFSPCLPV